MYRPSRPAETARKDQETTATTKAEAATKNLAAVQLEPVLLQAGPGLADKPHNPGGADGLLEVSPDAGATRTAELGDF